jgi:hypothetical protein
MVLLPLEPAAAAEALALAKQLGCAIWLGSDAITEAEFSQRGSEGIKITRFIYPLSGASAGVLQDALDTVVLHHPGEVVWVQHVAPP